MVLTYLRFRILKFPLILPLKTQEVEVSNGWPSKSLKFERLPVGHEWGPSYLYVYIYIYIRANYNNSLTWIKAIWGWFLLLTMIIVRSQWGRYNLPRYMNLTWNFFHEHLAPFLNAERVDHHRIHSTRFCFIGGRQLPRHRADTFACFPCFPHLKNVWPKCFQTSLWPLKNVPTQHVFHCI